MGYDDKFCQKCGARRGEGEYEPIYNDFTDILYGSPDIIRFKCPSCGNCCEILTGIPKEKRRICRFGSFT